MKIFKFLNFDCYCIAHEYGNGRTALVIKDANDISDPTPVCVATVNLPDQPLNDDEVFIKDWSENEGIYNALVGANIISKEIGRVKTGFVEAIKCKFIGI